ncbi:MAG: diguanylate cyclase [Rubrivivax sp.]|nr:diguanylate cyclase [Rubrivivax sp.]
MTPVPPLPPERSALSSAPAPLPAALPRTATAATSNAAGHLAGHALLLAALALVLAAVVAYALTALLDAPGNGWAAAVAAAAGVAVVGLPLGWLLLKRADEMAPGSGRADAAHAPPAGMPPALFMTLAEREFARARRYGTGAALVLVDIDRVMRLCQARGAAAGEAVLAEMLRRTAPTLRTADVLTYLGASQMAVFLVHADATGALDVAERIRERSEQMEVLFPETANGLRLRVTVSAGVAHLRPAHLSLQAMIDDALDAVAAARAAGGNCVRAAPVDPGAPGAPGVWRDRRAKTPPQPPRPGHTG